MKKSGSYWSWALFGFLVEYIFLSLISLFIAPVAFSSYFLFSIAFVAVIFVFYRYVIDWEIFDNKVEDDLRLLSISNNHNSRMLFSSLGGVVLVIAHPQLLHMGIFKIFVLATAAVTVSNMVYEIIRILYNKLYIAASKYTTNKEVVSHG